MAAAGSGHLVLLLIPLWIAVAGALAGALVGWLHDGTAYPMALVIAGLGLAGVLAHLLGGALFHDTNER